MRILLLALAISAVLLLQAQPAACWRYCGGFPCFKSSECFEGCACVASEDDGIGKCVSLQ